jgi:hypothetical protein
MSSPSRRSVVGAARARHPRAKSRAVAQSPPGTPSSSSQSPSARVGAARAQGPWTGGSPSSSLAHHSSSVSPDYSSATTELGAAGSIFGQSVGVPASTTELRSAGSSSPGQSVVSAGGVPAVINPQNLNSHVFLKSFVHAHKLQNRPVNTKRAIDPKIREWEAYCNYVYPEVPEQDRYTLNSDNTYKFMLYQAMRPKKPLGGTKRSIEELEAVKDDEEERMGEVSVSRGGRGAIGFCHSTYDAVMDRFADRNINLLNTGEDLPHPDDPLGFSQVNTYKASLITVYELQKTSGVLPELPFAHTIWQHDHQCLMALVKGRKQKVATARFDEKMTGESTPYTQVELIPKIESVLWNMGRGRTSRSQHAALRSRHAFLMTYAGIMRYESLHERNLSDLYSFLWRGEKDIHDILVTMFQLPSGKQFVVCSRLCITLFVLTTAPFPPSSPSQVKPIMVFKTYCCAPLVP